MYHQFKQLGTLTSPAKRWRSGRPRITSWAGCGSMPTPRCRPCRVSAAGECAAGINGAIGSGAIHSPICWFLENARRVRCQVRPGEFARRNRPAVAKRPWPRKRSCPFAHDDRIIPYIVQRELQEGHATQCRDRARGKRDKPPRTFENVLGTRAKVGVTGTRDFNPGWHTALDLKNLLTVSEAITRAALERKESRGAQFREDYRKKARSLRKVNTIVWKGDDGGNADSARRDPGDA